MVGHPSGRAPVTTSKAVTARATRKNGARGSSHIRTNTNTMKFNFLKFGLARAQTTNLAGGDAFVETPKLELASLLLTTTLTDEFYRTGDAAATRVKQLVSQISDPKFTAKAALYARKEAGLRSVTHLVA